MFKNLGIREKWTNMDVHFLKLTSLRDAISLILTYVHMKSQN